MQCVKCQQSITAPEVKVYVEAPTSLEVQLTCDGCGHVYSNWIEHNAWADAAGDPVDLTSRKPRDQRARGGRR